MDLVTIGYFDGLTVDTAVSPPQIATISGLQICGSWQDLYTSYHARVRSGDLHPRYAVSVAVEAGLADNMIGLISEFYYALLSGRAFVRQTYGDMPPLEAAFDYSSVNWSSPGFEDELFDHLKFTYKGIRGYSGNRSPPSGTDHTKYASIYHINSDQLSLQFFMSNLTLQPEGQSEVPYVFFASNRGNSLRLFDNPFHTNQLERMGLRPDLSFFCAFQYLFKPNAAVTELAKPSMEVLADPDILKIGIAIRTGDWTAFKGDDNVSLATYSAFFDCAREIELSRQVPGQKVVWYLISDSLQLRKQAKEKFGAKLLTDTSTKHSHIDCNWIGNSTCNEAILNQALQRAVADVVTFSQVDYHVIQLGSGFGKLGAMLSPKGLSHHIYLMYGLSNRTCGIFDYNMPESLLHGAGV